MQSASQSLQVSTCITFKTLSLKPTLLPSGAEVDAMPEDTEHPEINKSYICQQSYITEL